jgi:hypothetical protein
MMKRSEGPLFSETGTSTRVLYLKICFMAKERQHLQMEMFTRETIKMARGMGLAPSLGLMGPNTTADGSRIRNMEWESSDGLMGLFIKATWQMTKGMAWVFIGILVATSIKAFIKMEKCMVSI